MAKLWLAVTAPPGCTCGQSRRGALPRYHFKDHALIARVGPVHAVHYAVLGRGDACVSQVTRNANTRHSIRDGHVGEKKAKLSASLALVVDPSDTSILVILRWFDRSSESPAATATAASGFSAFVVNSPSPLNAVAVPRFSCVLGQGTAEAGSGVWRARLGNFEPLVPRIARL